MSKGKKECSSCLKQRKKKIKVKAEKKRREIKKLQLCERVCLCGCTCLFMLLFGQTNKGLGFGFPKHRRGSTQQGWLGGGVSLQDWVMTRQQVEKVFMLPGRVPKSKVCLKKLHNILSNKALIINVDEKNMSLFYATKLLLY